MKEEPEVTKTLSDQHGITDQEYVKMLEICGRNPSYTELGIFCVMWSEHCSYKSSRVHLKKFPTKAPHVLQGPGENAGIVDIGEGLTAVFKMESHNHPSFIEPYQGAATGVGGILRDIFTMGARPIASMNSLRFGSFSHPRTRYLLSGVIAGIGGYGNCIGVPTVGGEISFNDCYNGNILVNVFNLGIARKDRIFFGRASGAGNPVIYVGSKTGRDGIHGASLLASAEFGEEAEKKRPTVQVGDPFTEKLLLEACLELMKTDCIVGIQDMGAAGLTCSTFEMASRGRSGILIDLDKVPRREEGMIPYEIMLSESQERMLLVARKGKEDNVLEIFRKWDLDAEIVGEVTSDGMVTVMHEGKRVVSLPAKPLAEESPVYNRPMKKPAYLVEVKKFNLSKIPVPDDLNETMREIISSPNIASKEWAYHQYDYSVRTNTVVTPGSDAAVIRVKGTKLGITITTDCNPLYCYLNPYEGAKLAVAEAARNLSCAGSRPLGITDCLNFGNPEKPEIMWQFSEAVIGIADACRFLDIPVISGNVSFYNETEGKAIFPTPTIGMAGLLDEVRLHLTQWFKREGDLIMLLGYNRDEFGGSEYLRLIHNIQAGPVPSLDIVFEKRVQDCVRQAASMGILNSAHDCSDGGFAVALAECCFSDEMVFGAEVNLSSTAATDSSAIRPDSLLFGETQSRIIVSLPERNLRTFEGIAAKVEIPYWIIGKVGGEDFTIYSDGEKLIDIKSKLLYDLWKNALAKKIAERMPV
ncbi:MAG: phosphoribosylformylglycinamidine synthase subunit PurL [Acidobacteriota bacterium]